MHDLKKKKKKKVRETGKWFCILVQVLEFPMHILDDYAI